MTLDILKNQEAELVQQVAELEQAESQAAEEVNRILAEVMPGLSHLLSGPATPPEKKPKPAQASAPAKAKPAPPPRPTAVRPPPSAPAEPAVELDDELGEPEADDWADLLDDDPGGAGAPFGSAG